MPTSAYTVTSGNSASGLTLNSGDTLVVSSGGTASSTTINAGGLETVNVGGNDFNAVISAGGSATILGTATGDSIYGTELVSATSAVANGDTVQSGGTLDLFLKSVTASGTTVLSGGSLNISGNATATNTVLSGGTISLQSNKAVLAGSLTFAGAATLQIASISSGFGDLATISGFGSGDVIDDTFISGGAVAFTTSGGNTIATITGSASSASFIFAGTTISNSITTMADANGGTELVYNVACFCEGTLIRTDAGDVAVEDLAIGDRVITVGGASEPIRWIGRRCYAGRNLAGRSHVLPVRIKAGALAANEPARDLLVSPLHAMLVDGVLVPAAALVNGSTVVREDGATSVRYVHFELDRHEAIWAEGAASETFVDDDGRFLFATAEGEAAGRPDGAATYYAPRVTDGPLLQSIRDRLASRSRLLETAAAA